MTNQTSLALRLAGPLQSWGAASQFNRRETNDRPSKSGVVGLLSAALGRRRGADIADLVSLTMGVRVDQPGSLLRDYHTVSTMDGSKLPSAAVSSKGIQKPSGKATHLTTRFYLQDAVFVVFLQGGSGLLEGLADAIQRPRFPLSLGRRSCPPSLPMLIPTIDGDLLHAREVGDLIGELGWQAGFAARERRRKDAKVSLAATIDSPSGSDVLVDVPVSFAHHERGFRARQVDHLWIDLPTGNEPEAGTTGHDPFELLGW